MPAIKPDTKIIDEVHRISDKRGNGQLRREVWENAKGEITRYNLAYVNHALFRGDNGRVIGYDNQHGYHHRHYFGKVSAVVFTSFEEVENLFETEWLALRSSV
jgi:Family of unknown function (DUF6516)